MRRGLPKGATSGVWWIRASLLPRRERVFLLILFGCAALPSGVALAGLVRGASDVASLSALCLLASAILVLAALIAFERPRSPSPIAYLEQLKVRLARMQADCASASRRRSEEEQHHGDNESP